MGDSRAMLWSAIPSVHVLQILDLLNNSRSRVNYIFDPWYVLDLIMRFLAIMYMQILGRNHNTFITAETPKITLF